VQYLFLSALTTAPQGHHSALPVSGNSYKKEQKEIFYGGTWYLYKIYIYKNVRPGFIALAVAKTRSSLSQLFFG